MIGYLNKAEELGDIGTQKIWDPLLVVFLADLHLHLPISPHIDRYLPDMSGYEPTLQPFKGGLHTGEVPG